MKRQSLLFAAAIMLSYLSASIPAHAQWTKGNTYSGITFVFNAQPGSTATNSPANTITCNSVGGANYYPGPYGSSATASATVYQDYNWSGPSGSARTDFSNTSDASGSASANDGEAGTKASSGVDGTHGSLNLPYTTSYDVPNQSMDIVYLTTGGPPNTTIMTYQDKKHLDASTSAAGPGGLATATATISFGAPAPAPILF